MNQEHKEKLHISVAPMMDWTDRHCRHFHRLIAPHIRLYTEMVTAAAILHGDKERLLGFDATQHPVALQLGGSDPAALAAASIIGAEFGYDEINLNCGCPSDRVQSGRFGACLMREPDLVAECVEAMRKSVDIPVTVKCRIGIDHEDSFEFLDRFVGSIADKGCKTFILHARKAWLNGLSPKENREVPVLDYTRVHAIKEKYPELCIIVNGGITTLEQIRAVTVDGAMIGREAYHNPWFLAEIEKDILNNDREITRADIVLKMIDYARDQKERHGTPIKSITRHIIGLYHNLPGAKSWRRALSTLPYEDGADEAVLFKALEMMEKKRKLAA